MTDNRTTEFIDEPDAIRNEFMDGGLLMADVHCPECILTVETESCGHETPEAAIEAAVRKWNTRATVGNGTLTAEQVRECTQPVYMEGYSDGSVNRGAHIDETDWQAIADELNAALGAGECEMEEDCEYVECKVQTFTCSSCYWRGAIDDLFASDTKPNFCPNCGRAVKR